MNQQQQANIFRLSAILYANDNYTISPVQLHRKVIEDALYQLSDSKGVTIEGLANYISDRYLIHFTDDEVRQVLNNTKFNNVFRPIPVGKEVVYTLQEERRKLLDERNPKTLDDYICEYVKLNGLGTDSIEAVYRYLYGVFTTNVDGFRRMTEAGDVCELTQYYSPDEKDTEIINGFLNWDNDEKNVAIFNLASYGLEYCLLTSKKGSHLNLEKLNKKVFYLDTNILYRALGINGVERKQRTHSFLRKLIEAEDEIKITLIAWNEYENSLNKYIKKLRRDQNPAIHSKVYTEYVTYDDIHRAYHLWASSTKNATVDLFVNMLKAEMLQLIEDYHIEIDRLCPFDKQQREEELNEMAVQIKSLSEHKYFDTAHNDACDIVWVEMCRKPGEENIFSTKTFLLSSDRGLFRWDSKYNSGSTPVVMLPSQWLSILLRYVSRTSDDYRSFVSFLNIQSKEGVLSAEQIRAILAGISEMTDKVEQQRYLLDVIIENEFKNGAGEKTNEQLKAIAKNDANRILQKQLSQVTKEAKELKKGLENIKGEFEEHKAETYRKLKEKSDELSSANEKISELKGSVDTLTQTSAALNEVQEEKKQLEVENDSLRKQLKKNKLKVWRGWKVTYGVVLILLSIMSCLMVFLWKESDWNLVYKFVQYLDGNKDSVAFSLGQAIVLLPLSIIAYGGYMIKDAFDTDELDKRRFFWTSKK